jgi:hypothetical protein
MAGRQNRLALVAVAGVIAATGLGSWVGIADAAPAHQATQRTGRYAPSAQWLKADLASRGEAYALMVGMVGHEQTCMADVAHSYRGAVKGGAHQGWDLVSTLHPGKHYVMGPYVKGVCDRDADLGFYAR